MTGQKRNNHYLSWIQYPVSVFIALVTIFFSFSLDKEFEHTLARHLKEREKQITTRIETTLNATTLALHRMASRWEHAGGTPYHLWKKDASAYVIHRESLTAVEYVTPEGIVKWVEPLKGNEKAVNLDLTFEKHRREAIEKARATRKATSTPIIPLVQGRGGFLSFFPIVVKNKLEGFILGVFDVDGLIEDLKLDVTHAGFYVELLTPGIDVTINTPVDSPKDSSRSLNTPIEFAHLTGTLRITPSKAYVKLHSSNWPFNLLLFGALIILLTNILIRALFKANIVISDRKKMQERLQKTNEELERFAYVASHDLQEPLRTISSYIELFEKKFEGQLDDKGKLYMDFIVGAARRMRNLIQALLAYSRTEKAVPDLVPVSVEALVGEVVRDMQTVIEKEKAVVICKSIPEVNADPRLLGVVFQNLIGNAIKYHGEAPPQVTISGQKQSNKVEILVEDNGIGIEKEFRNQIFEVFKRLHNSSKYEGTGIGLSIAKKVVEKHGGNITVDGSSSGGSVFKIVLPS